MANSKLRPTSGTSSTYVPVCESFEKSAARVASPESASATAGASVPSKTEAFVFASRITKRSAELPEATKKATFGAPAG